MRRTAARIPVFEIVELDCAAHVETVVGRAGSSDEANRLIAELAADARPSTFFIWIARAA